MQDVSGGAFGVILVARGPWGCGGRRWGSIPSQRKGWLSHCRRECKALSRQREGSGGKATGDVGTAASHRGCECGGVHGVVAEVHPREGSIEGVTEGRQKKN